MYYCVPLNEKAIASLDKSSSSRSSFVIRSTGFHSSKGIYIFSRGINGGVELIRGISMTLDDILSDLNTLSRTNAQTSVIIEEYIPGPSGGLPTEYKFHVFTGVIGSIIIVDNRGTSYGCWAEFNDVGERLDQFGCFTPVLFPDANVNDNNVEQSFNIDFNAGALSSYPIKGFDLCSDVPCQQSIPASGIICWRLPEMQASSSGSTNASICSSGQTGRFGARIHYQSHEWFAALLCETATQWLHLLVLPRSNVAGYRRQQHPQRRQETESKRCARLQRHMCRSKLIQVALELHQRSLPFRSHLLQFCQQQHQRKLQWSSHWLRFNILLLPLHLLHLQFCQPHRHSPVPSAEHHHTNGSSSGTHTRSVSHLHLLQFCHPQHHFNRCSLRFYQQTLRCFQPSPSTTDEFTVRHTSGSSSAAHAGSASSKKRNQHRTYTFTSFSKPSTIATEVRCGSTNRSSTAARRFTV